MVRLASTRQRFLISKLFLTFHSTIALCIGQPLTTYLNAILFIRYTSYTHNTIHPILPHPLCPSLDIRISFSLRTLTWEHILMMSSEMDPWGEFRDCTTHSSRFHGHGLETAMATDLELWDVSRPVPSSPIDVGIAHSSHAVGAHPAPGVEVLTRHWRSWFLNAFGNIQSPVFTGHPCSATSHHPLVLTKYPPRSLTQFKGLEPEPIPLFPCHPNFHRVLLLRPQASCLDSVHHALYTPLPLS